MDGKKSVRKGVSGEEYAARLLREKGYRILKANFRTKQGEIDIIAENGEYIAFVEVKTRKAGALSPGYQAVTRSKQRRIISAAQCYLCRFPVDLQPRFDVICLETSHGAEFQVLSAEYYINAFTAEGISPF